MQDNPELTTPLAITFLEEQPTEPEETTPAPETASLEDILDRLDIGEAQAAEQKANDEMFLETLNSLDALEWTNDIDELGEAETVSSYVQARERTRRRRPWKSSHLLTSQGLPSSV